MGLQSQLLLRTLVTYRHVTGPAGVVPVPDLATDTGQVSPDGLTWTFHLKDGVRFGPPVRRPVTPSDVEFAFRRIDTLALGAQYGYLYDGLIQGMDGPVERMPTDVSGIETPGPRTVEFHLTHPAGDFPQRLAMPAAAPMSSEVAGCFTKSGDYGGDLVSSGPYMIRGADLVDASSCGSIIRMAGFEPTRDLFMVRNPEYDASTDNPAVRESYPNSIDIRIHTSPTDNLRDVGDRTLDATLGTISAPVRSATDLHLKLRWEPTDAIEYLPMNVLVPPFDDVHVRRAVNLALDRNAILWALGVNARGRATTHIFPPALTGSEGPQLFPPGGDLAAAQREMARSPYDTDGDGVCNSEVCSNLLFIAPFTPPWVNAVPVIVQELSAIGVDLKFRELDPGTVPYTTVETVKNLVPIALNHGPVADYPDPEAIARSLHSSGISCEDQVNYSEVGISEGQASECGVESEYRKVRDHVPNLDGRIDACERLKGNARSACWAEFDRYVMTEVVPWAPIRFPDTLIVTGRTVTKFEYDQAFGMISLCHVAVSTAGI